MTMPKPNTTSGPVLTFMTKNVDRPITLDELETELGLTRGQCSNAANNLITSGKYPNMERTGAGVYLWRSKPASEPETLAEDTEMLVVVVRVSADGRVLVKDTSTTNLFTLTPYEF